MTNELCNVLIKKFGRSTEEIHESISAMETVCNIAILTVETTKNALNIQRRYGYSFYDALILSCGGELRHSHPLFLVYPTPVYVCEE